MAIVEDGVVLAIGFADLVKALGDQVCADAVARHEGERGLEKLEPPQRRKLVQHHQQLVLAASLGVAFEPFGQASTDLVQHQPDKRLGTSSEEHTSELQHLMRKSYAV